MYVFIIQNNHFYKINFNSLFISEIWNHENLITSKSKSTKTKNKIMKHIIISCVNMWSELQVRQKKNKMKFEINEKTQVLVKRLK